MQKHEEIFLLKLQTLSFAQVMNFKMPLIGILKLMTRTNVMCMWVEHEKCFITSEPEKHMTQVVK